MSACSRNWWWRLTDKMLHKTAACDNFIAIYLILFVLSGYKSATQLIYNTIDINIYYMFVRPFVCLQPISIIIQYYRCFDLVVIYYLVILLSKTHFVHPYFLYLYWTMKKWNNHQLNDLIDLLLIDFCKTRHLLSICSAYFCMFACPALYQHINQ